MLLKELEKIIKIVEKSEIAELEWEKNKERIRIRKDFQGAPATMSYSLPAQVPAAAPAAPVKAAPAAEAAPAPKAENSRAKEVLSPFVGTYYAAASPTAPKYVEVGARVKKGDVLCIIEAMKLFNEIESEVKGKIVKIMVDDASPVEYDQVLFLVEPG